MAPFTTVPGGRKPDTSVGPLGCILIAFVTFALFFGAVGYLAGYSAALGDHRVVTRSK